MSKILYIKIFKFVFLMMALVVELAFMVLMGVTVTKISLLGLTLMGLCLTCETIVNKVTGTSSN